MLQHYLRMALRGLVRRKLYSFINVAGKAPPALLTEMKAHIPEVRAVVHVKLTQVTVYARGGQFLETATAVDPNFFRVIELPLLEGSPGRVLDSPASVVLSRSEARKYFGNTNPVGKILTIGGLGIGCKPSDSACLTRSRPFIVSGVLRDLPHNTQLAADIVVPDTYQATQAQATSLEYGYVKLAPDTDPGRVLAEVRTIQDRALDLRKLGIDQNASDLEKVELIPFRDVHLTGGRAGEMKPAGNRTMVYGFGVIALLIVLVASCNFMNLARAIAALRAREIPVRKISGATRAQVFLQFSIEAIVTMAVSMVIATAVVEVVLPAYDRFVGVPLDIHYLKDWRIPLVLLLGGIGIGALSGIYPALVLSGLAPAVALRGNTRAGSTTLRSALVIGQFAVSIALAVAAIIVFRQIQFVRALDLGFNRDDLVVTEGATRLAVVGVLGNAMFDGLREPVQPMVFLDDPGASSFVSIRVRRDQVAQALPFIAKAWRSLAPEAVLDRYFLSSAFASLLAGDESQGEVFGVFDGLAVFISCLGLFGLAVFTAERRTKEIGPQGLRCAYGPDRAAHVVAYLASRADREPRGLARRLLLSSPLARSLTGYPQRSLFPGCGRCGAGHRLGDGIREQSPARASVYVITASRYLALSIKVRAGQMPEAESYIDRTLRSFAPNLPLTRSLLSDSFDGLFLQDEKEGAMFAAFSGIAVLIACLGLFGLVVFTAERSTKEIGIRKVSGARTFDVVRLMLWRISLPVHAANVIAWPIAYFYLHRWLEGYAYRITLDPRYFLAAGACALLIACATVYGNTLLLARTSPVRALRYE